MNITFPYHKKSLYLHETNVFTIEIDQLESYLQIFYYCLSIEEKTKATEIRCRIQKKRYIISHGFLRFLLGECLSIFPSKVEYSYNKFQKPLCKQDPNLYFNMSHSNNYVCYVFSFNYKVGIDIEFINNIFKIEDLLPSIAAPEEALAFDKPYEADKAYLFYKMWTIKEAFLKALGIGLSYPLSDIETTILPREKFKILTFDGSKKVQNEWTFMPIKFIPSYLGTVAVEKENEKINFHTLTSLCFS